MTGVCVLVTPVTTIERERESERERERDPFSTESKSLVQVRHRHPSSKKNLWCDLGRRLGDPDRNVFLLEGFDDAPDV